VHPVLHVFMASCLIKHSMVLISFMVVKRSACTLSHEIHFIWWLVLGTCLIVFIDMTLLSFLTDCCLYWGWGINFLLFKNSYKWRTYLSIVSKILNFSLSLMWEKAIQLLEMYLSASSLMPEYPCFIGFDVPALLVWGWFSIFSQYFCRYELPHYSVFYKKKTCHHDSVHLLCGNFLSVFEKLKSRDSSVGVVLGYGLDDQGLSFWFLARVWNFSLHHHIQNISGAHPASYPMGTRGSFPGVRAAGAWSWPLTSI
jgi:hypothetical protein